MLMISNITKNYDKFKIDINLEVQQGEFLSILGPSGCGKTTLLRVVSGLEYPDSGQILLDGIDITQTDPGKRGIGLVFQDYALFPHLSVKDNIQYGLARIGLPRIDRRNRLEAMLDLTDLNGLENRDVATLSGGEKQRVALARSIAMQPKILLLDEPFSALDPSLRVTLRREIYAIIKRTGITTIFVTHNPEEALSMSDRIAVIYGGKIVQVDTARKLYDHPANAFTASFTGPVNNIDAEIIQPEGNFWTVSIGTGRFTANSEKKWIPGQGASMVFRPEKACLRRNNEGFSNCLDGIIFDSEYLGGYTRYTVKTAVGNIKVNIPSDGESFTVGEPAAITVPPEHCTLCERVDTTFGLHSA